MALTEEEKKEAFKKWIEEHVGFEIDWLDPPGAATIALDRLMSYDAPPGVASEKIDDLAQSYISYAGLDPVTRDFLKEIRKVKW